MVLPEERKGDFMQQVYHANPNYDLNTPLISTQINFFLNKKGRLCQIVWYHKTAGKIAESVWGNIKREQWDLEDANENDLIRVFTKLALGNPKDFKELYLTLKEHDEVTFPYIEETLKQVKELFNFD